MLYGALPTTGSLLLFIVLLGFFALQDSFGTACDLTGDGALTMIVNKKIALGGKSL